MAEPFGLVPFDEQAQAELARAAAMRHWRRQARGATPYETPIPDRPRDYGYALMGGTTGAALSAIPTVVGSGAFPLNLLIPPIATGYGAKVGWDASKQKTRDENWGHPF